MEYMYLGTRIRKAREKCGLTQGQLANRIGVKRTSIERWETDQSVPRINKLTMMSGVLDVPLLWLLAGGEAVPDQSADEASKDELVQAKIELAEQHMAELNQLLSELKLLTSKQAAPED